LKFSGLPYSGMERYPSPKLAAEIHSREKCFVILAKSFVKIWITKTFCYNNKMFSSVNKTFAAAKYLVAGTKNLFVVYFCCRNKTIFSLVLLP